ncbi:DUF4240 domain-containing protein [Cellulomonas endophytica]|uniref:DUF4240 domain-containing protein n=1 Tax=Cellulomonas endophytica TaxID=2494735 RepID=UPI0013E937F5|nr:DUF4240 domain-containing protein [Cellulomonas endophytica]
MDTDTFWALVDEARDRSDGSIEQQAEVLQELLERRPVAEVVAFARRYDELRADLYRQDLWAAAYALQGGCSDDGFSYFRSWVISRGADAYRTALTDPDGLVAWVEEPTEADEAETLDYAADQAYESLTGGEELPASGVHDPGEPAGDPWSEDDLPARFPRMTARGRQDAEDDEDDDDGEGDDEDGTPPTAPGDRGSWWSRLRRGR